MSITQQQYTTAVFTADRANAALILSLRAKEALGAYPNWNLAACQDLKIESGMWSLSMGDYTSDASVDIYNQLVDIGSTWFGGIAFDPNAQGAGGVEVINVISTPEPIQKILYTSFDAATQQSDGGRFNYFNTDWKGFNPVLSLTSPGEAALNIGDDYVLIPSGGISLLPTSTVLPFIYPGQFIRATSYTPA